MDYIIRVLKEYRQCTLRQPDLITTQESEARFAFCKSIDEFVDNGRRGLTTKPLSFNMVKGKCLEFQHLEDYWQDRRIRKLAMKKQDSFTCRGLNIVAIKLCKKKAQQETEMGKSETAYKNFMFNCVKTHTNGERKYKARDSVKNFMFEL